MSAPSGATLTGATAAVRALADAGVEVAFGLPGVHNLSLWRALADSPIRLVGVRHEQTAGYAADGYARAGGRLGVALVTTGPGAANTLAAVGEAFASRSPVLVIATDIATSLRRPHVWRGALHETTDQAAMFAPVTKATVRVGAPEEIGASVARAAALAQAPPARPVYVELPTDLLDAEVSGNDAASAAERHRPAPIAVDQVGRAAALLASSRAPLVWAGGGAVTAGAGQAVAELAERLAAPVVTTYAGRGLLPPDHPCEVGLPPHVPEVGAMWDEADCVVAVGSDLDGMSTQNWAQPAPPHLVAINVDPQDAAKNYLPDVLLEGDAAAGAAALARAIEARTGLQHLEHRLRELRAAVLGRLRAGDPEALALLDAVAALPPEATLVCDMCIPGYWIGGFHRPAAPRRLLYPLGWGTLGCAFPQALGAALAAPGPVVAVVGDGGFLYACGELATARQERIPLTVVIVDDGGYGMLRFDQDRAGHPRAGVDLESPDFAALASAFGVPAETVDGLGDEFATMLAGQVGLAQPTVLVARAALSPPPTVSPRWYRHGRQ